MSKVISLTQVRETLRADLASLATDGENDHSCIAVLNALFCSLVAPDNRRRFRAFPEGYCREYGLSLEQIHAVTDLDMLRLLKLGSTPCQLDRLTSIYGLDANALCVDQTGKTLADTLKALTQQSIPAI